MGGGATDGGGAVDRMGCGVAEGVAVEEDNGASSD